MRGTGRPQTHAANAAKLMLAVDAELSSPLLVEAGVGNNWDEAH
jgi:hypothetical protein